MKRQISIYDTTLRDGAQAEGVSLTVQDKLNIARRLDALGVHYIEGGWPGSNAKDKEFFEKARKLTFKKARLTAFSSTHHPKSPVDKDVILKTLLHPKCKVDTATIFGKSWDLHVRDVFRISLEENLRMIFETVDYLKSKKLEVIYDAEHFFDGFKANPEYALKSLLRAEEAGADAIVLCDTNGGTVTAELVRIIEEVKKHVSAQLGIHCHNDSEMAVANSIAAVQAGCTQVQGTINGYGERCGNANLCSIIPTLQGKLGVACLNPGKLKELTEVSHYIAEVCNMRQAGNQPYVGASAFAHKGGVHINAVMKNPVTYEHIDPALIGNKRRILVSELSGRSAILYKKGFQEIDLEKNTPQTKKLHKLLQTLEHQGYQFEAAEASFELLMKRAMKKYTPFFSLKGFRVSVEKRQDNTLISEATIKVKVNRQEVHTAAEGDGPVNALDSALRKALETFYPSLNEMHLSDFKVRVLDEKAGTAAKVRVLIQSQDARESWGTVGVSENIIEASWQALVDSVEYKLLKDRSQK
ncbi:MAG: citramalate synthase [Candidatus Omnitrophica bacterium]|nr:citramalate synthase [Candidatus Omnitrophota bacterium]